MARMMSWLKKLGPVNGLLLLENVNGNCINSFVGAIAEPLTLWSAKMRCGSEISPIPMRRLRSAKRIGAAFEAAHGLSDYRFRQHQLLRCYMPQPDSAGRQESVLV